MNTEIWDIIDENGQSTGKTTLRGHCSLKQGEYHLVVHIWVVSSSGKFLIQKRSDTKPLMPGEWAATGGAAIKGENSFEAARRELFEELSIKSTKNTLKKITRIKRRNSLLDVWFINCDVNPRDLILQKSEVAEVKWSDEKDLKQMIKTGTFHNYGKEYFDIVLNTIDNYRGAII